MLGPHINPVLLSSSNAIPEHHERSDESGDDRQRHGRSHFRLEEEAILLELHRVLSKKGRPISK